MLVAAKAGEESVAQDGVVPVVAKVLYPHDADVPLLFVQVTFQ